MNNEEKKCKCINPQIDEAYSICLKCLGQLGSYQQCMNCWHNQFTILGIFKCRKYGWQTKSQAKKIQHCADQIRITY